MKNYLTYIFLILGTLYFGKLAIQTIDNLVEISQNEK
jgi:hypothetical protein